MNSMIAQFNYILWNYVLLYCLLGVGLFFTFKLRFIQFFYFGEMFRSLNGKPADSSGISSFQALMISLASRVGTGNLTGVAVALYLGGPGTIFWMWVVGLLGMATAYSECTLAQLYKVKQPNGQYRGGPAFYIARGLNSRWLAMIFSGCLVLNFGIIFVAVQANSIADAALGAFTIPKPTTGLVLASLCIVVVLGGIHAIARVIQVVMPFMAITYLLLALFVVIANYTLVPDVLYQIVTGAFGLQEAAGGAAGSLTAAMLNGVKRGFFSNEAGMGSAPNIAAVARPDPHHPAAQGLAQALGVFIDTLLICTATAIMILLSGTLDPNSSLTGAQLTQSAMEVHFGWAGKYFIALAIFCFAFAAILGNFTYAESAMSYLKASSGMPLYILRCVFFGSIVWGAGSHVESIFCLADITMGLMGSINIVALVLLSDAVIRVTYDYFNQRKLCKAPEFDMAFYPEIRGLIDRQIWSPQRA